MKKFYIIAVADGFVDPSPAKKKTFWNLLNADTKENNNALPIL